MKYRVSELEGALLDAAVAECGEWKTAHGHFQTMTLDPTFKGWRLIRFRSELVCLLEPNNPMRQDPKQYSPSAEWAIGGPIIERERIMFSDLTSPAEQDDYGSIRATISRAYGLHWADGPTHLIAAMRAYVAASLGPEVELPEAPE